MTAIPLELPAGITTRAITPDDLPFLRAVYASARADEMALIIHWTPEQKAAFIDTQFNLQHTYYHEHYIGADFLVILQAGQAIGRVYIAPMPGEYRLMEITLLPASRGQGIGGAIIRALMRRAEQDARAVRLHVERENHAFALYTRLGFRVIEDRGVYQFMEWQPSTPTQG